MQERLKLPTQQLEELLLQQVLKQLLAQQVRQPHQLLAQLSLALRVVLISLLQQPVVHDHQQEVLPQQEQDQLLLAQQEQVVALVQQLEEQVVRHNQHVRLMRHHLVLTDISLLVGQMQTDVQERPHVSLVLNILHLLLIFVLAVTSSAEEQMKSVAKYHQPVNQE